MLTAVIAECYVYGWFFFLKLLYIFQYCYNKYTILSQKLKVTI